VSNLAGRVVAITGGAGGLGLLTTEELLRQGARVVANYRSAGDGLDELAEKYPGALHPVPGDVATEPVAEAVAAAAKRLGRLDVLVHNAATTRDGLLVRMSAADWDEVVRVNLRGAFLATKHAVRLMMRARYGRVIYVSSLAAVIGNAGQANYAASKAGLHGLSNAVAQEYSAYNIRSVVLAPGLLDTGLGNRLAPQLQAQKTGRSLLGLGTGESIASTIAFLAGPGADYINATVIRSDGGVVY
jgi:3-oxoacyl-[acyl-carrier protein] reductase